MDLLEDDDTINAINIAPLVDVCLVLLLVFMVTMPLSALYGITVKSNVLSRYGITTPVDHVVVHLTVGGIFIVTDDKRENRVPYDQFGVVVRQLIQTSAAKDVMVRIDPEVPHGQTVWALDLAKQNGADQISIFEGGAS